jgi:hypothetical protein
MPNLVNESFPGLTPRETRHLDVGHFGWLATDARTALKLQQAITGTSMRSGR